MPYFRELPLKKILLVNFILGLTTGWFFVQGFKLMLGLVVFGGLRLTMFFYRLLGLQLSFFIFIVVWVIDKKYWEKHRVKTPPAKPTAAEYRSLLLTLLVYAAGAGLINLVRLFSKKSAQSVPGMAGDFHRYGIKRTDAAFSVHIVCEGDIQ